MDRWPHQVRGVELTLQAQAAGIRRLVLSSPTGGGKSLMATDLIRDWTAAGLRTSIYTNRKMLVEQLQKVLTAAGIEHGVRAAGHEDRRELPVQISSIQTEGNRVLRREEHLAWQLHDAHRVLIDECHIQTGQEAQQILNLHTAAGAYLVGLSATPLGLADLYDHLVTAGTTSELRRCGALLPCRHYGPDEPDMKILGKRIAEGDDLSEQECVKLMMTVGIFGRVLTHYRKLNPEQKPAILFAPGVKESLWFAQEFTRAGIPAAHIDGTCVWVDGQFYETSPGIRQEVLDGSRNGSVRVICNRFVLREGVDCPWLYHGIFATVFGSLQSYLQSGGRLLRHHPSLESVILQDHGGNWWRHGSLNADREWRLEYTSSMLAGRRADRFRLKLDREPYRCPECTQILTTKVCPCGFEVGNWKPSRPVIQHDGSLKEMYGDIFRPHRIYQGRDLEKRWASMYYRARKTGMTFRQAEALFAVENHWEYPPRTLKLMPREEIDWFRAVKDIPPERLLK